MGRERVKHDSLSDEALSGGGEGERERDGDLAPRFTLVMVVCVPLLIHSPHFVGISEKPVMLAHGRSKQRQNSVSR